MATTNDNVWAIGYHSGYPLRLNNNGSVGHTNHEDNITSFTKWNGKRKDISIHKLNLSANGVIVIDNNQHHWSMGNNACGECGINNQSQSIKELTQITYFQDNNINIKQIFTSIAGSSIFWLTTDGNVYGNGKNHHYELGIADKQHKYTPTLIPTLSTFNIQKICSGIGFSVALTTNGDVLTTSGFKNALKWRHKQSLIDKTFINIACGDKHILFLDSNGRIWSCGDNRYGQLGKGDYNNKNHSSSLISFNDRYRIIKIECGCYHNLALDEGGNVWSWGRNHLYQCGDGTDKIATPQMIDALNGYNIVDIKCGYNHSYALSDNGEHFLFGSNTYNECCLVSNIEKRAVKTPLCINQIVAHKTNGKGIIEVYLGNGNTMVAVGYQDVEEKTLEPGTKGYLCNDPYSELQKEYESMKAEYCNMNDKYNGLNDKYTEIYNNLKMLQRKYNTLNTKHSKMKNTKYQQTQVLDGLYEENEEIKRRLSRLRNRNDELEKECDGLRSNEVLIMKTNDELKLKIKDIDICDEFICSITMDIMNDPVICVDGNTYERSAIENWLSTNHTSPKTNMLLQNNTLIPNRALKYLIDDWKKRNSN